ncbi:hypothetical protein JCM24511_10102 [Saitozyma sp. JCM 24511]|nr:hypothetical protein JCM24511_10102 [Saitozyma sp. JCM 24511]
MAVCEHGWFSKRFIYEESFQMPFLVKGPGIKAGKINYDIISNVDFAPTWLEFAGAAIPSYMQGESFLHTLLGKGPKQSEDTVAYHRYWMHRENIHNSYAHYGIRDKRYKLIFWYNQGLGLPHTKPGGDKRVDDQEWELFDCQEDPMELFNLWANHEYAEVRERMLRLLEAKILQIGDLPAHPVAFPAEKLVEMYIPGANIAVRAEQHNL